MDAYVATLARPAWDKKSDTNVRGDKLEVIVQVPVVTQSMGRGNALPDLISAQTRV